MNISDTHKHHAPPGSGDFRYRELNCRRKHCKSVFSSDHFETECPKCRKRRLALQRKCRERGVPFRIKMLEVANAIAPAYNLQ